MPDAALRLVLTEAGLDALVDAREGRTTAIAVTQVGITAQAFQPSAALTALPGELRRLDAVSGMPVDATTIHMTATDASDQGYEVRGFALYLADGTLFGSWGQAEPIFVKASIATFVFQTDIAFRSTVAGAITFGDATFVNPPATEAVKGVAKIATTADADAGTDDAKILTILKARRLLDALAALLGGRLGALEAGLLADIGALANRVDLDLDALARDIAAVAARLDVDIDQLGASLAALGGRSVVGRGLAAGGGNLTADREITVLQATDLEAVLGQRSDRAITPVNIAAVLANRTVGGEGLVTGGGDLTQNRLLKVLAATADDLVTGTANDRAVTPAALANLPKLLEVSGRILLPGGLLLQWVRGGLDGPGSETARAITFPLAFATECLSALVTTSIASASANADVWYQVVGQPYATGCTVQRQRGSGTSDPVSTTPIIWALGH